MADTESKDNPSGTTAEAASTKEGDAHTDVRTGGPASAAPRPESAGDDTPATTAAPVPEQLRPRRPAFQNVADLLTAFYTGPRKVPAVTAHELAAIQSAAQMQPEDQRRLLELAASDRTLDRTRLLMLFWVNRLYGTKLAEGVRELVRTVLRAHPAFQLASLLSLLDDESGGPDEDAAARALSSRPFDSLRWPPGVATLKKAEAIQCRANAMVCLVLWLREVRGTSLDRLLRYLNTHLWTGAAQRLKSERHQLSALATARDLPAVAVVYALLDEQLSQKTQDALTARKAEERATARAQNADAALVECQTRCNTIQETVGVLTKELEDEKRAREVDNAHARDDYEKLRGRLLQRLKTEVSLLDEGLHALRRDPPKPHVMLDHADRVIDNLKREMTSLRGEAAE